MSSREDTPISVDADDFSLDNVTDSSLKALLQEETKLKAQLDALTTEIAKLESQINPAPKEDDDEGKWEYSEWDARSWPIRKSTPIGGFLASLIGTTCSNLSYPNLWLSRTEIDMEEFEAPQWCVPIKANVMNFDWDVSLL